MRRKPRQGAPQGADRQRDEGSSLILALVLVLIGTLLVLPIMDYTMAVTRANRTVSTSATRAEAVKAGLRVALQDPVKLYQACSGQGTTTGEALAAPPGMGVQTECFAIAAQSQNLPSEQRYALTTVQSGSNAYIPPPYVIEVGDSPEFEGTISRDWCTSMSDPDPTKRVPCGRQYPLSGDVDPTRWLADVTELTTLDKVWLPHLPPFSNTLAYSGGYPMPDYGDGPCIVFFPGKYVDPVVITGSTPVYFTSGIYYFENTVRISGDAHVVVGAGSAPGCVESDAVAVADAIGAPFDAYSNGVGGTWVFGHNGRLVIDTATASTGTGVDLAFNRRLVGKDDVLAPLNDVSIMSVTGVLDEGAGTTSDLDVDLNADLVSDLHVPATPVFGGADAWSQRYRSSKLVSTAAAPVPCGAAPADVTVCPIIDIDLSTAARVKVDVPGYVSVPQGSVSLVVAAGVEADKDLAFGGGVLAAQLVIPTSKPAALQIGLVKTVVQQTFKIVTDTTSGMPHVQSVALVQVNESGGYAVNSWVVQSG